MRAVAVVFVFLAASTALSTVAAEQDSGFLNAMKRSLALGRMGFRPGKRSVEEMLDEHMDKRSLALGRMGFRPGKRSSAALSFVDPNALNAVYELITEDQMGKRSIALGRAGFRPAKRSLALGRSGFRPGKRSIALGRERFRPGKRSVTEAPFQVATGQCQMAQLEQAYNTLLKVALEFETMTAKCTDAAPFPTE